uniref:Uncharacterized protein n=1 Tax=Lactuca sativa TaxID=4236 RepID=A0A9R1UFX6_LACSA|nr:hypothetical protein LSAT_V11C900485500 [Lactuca sativa]
MFYQVLFSSKEEPDALIPHAMYGLLTIHKWVMDVDADPIHPPVGKNLPVIALHDDSVVEVQGEREDANAKCPTKLGDGSSQPSAAAPPAQNFPANTVGGPGYQKQNNVPIFTKLGIYFNLNSFYYLL